LRESIEQSLFSGTTAGALKKNYRHLKKKKHN